MFCRKCGAENPDNATYCKVCGMQLKENPKPAANPAARAPASVQRDGARAPAGVQRDGTRARRPILTTRKTSSPYLCVQMVIDSVFIALAVFFLIRGAELIDSFWYREEGEKLQMAGYAFFVAWFLAVSYHMMISRTYLDLFNGRISGMGMQGVQCKSFELRFDQIVGLSVSKGFLGLESGAGSFVIVNTIAGEYKIITTNARASEIMECYSNGMSRPRARRER